MKQTSYFALHRRGQGRMIYKFWLRAQRLGLFLFYTVCFPLSSAMHFLFLSVPTPTHQNGMPFIVSKCSLVNFSDLLPPSSSKGGAMISHSLTSASGPQTPTLPSIAQTRRIFSLRSAFEALTMATFPLGTSQTACKCSVSFAAGSGTLCRRVRYCLV